MRGTNCQSGGICSRSSITPRTRPQNRGNYSRGEEERRGRGRPLDPLLASRLGRLKLGLLTRASPSCLTIFLLLSRTHIHTDTHARMHTHIHTHHLSGGITHPLPTVPLRAVFPNPNRLWAQLTLCQRPAPAWEKQQPAGGPTRGCSRGNSAMFSGLQARQRGVPWL